MSDHQYLSTACVHARHAECRLTCKFCQQGCSCGCHADVADPANAIIDAPAHAASQPAQPIRPETP